MELTSYTNPIANLKTLTISEVLDARKHLERLDAWNKEYIRNDLFLLNYLEEKTNANSHKLADPALGARISTMRLLQKLNKIKYPIQSSNSEAENAGQNLDVLHEKLAVQFAGFTPDNRKVWLNNFDLIITPDLRQLMEKIEKLLTFNAANRARNFLLGGPAGMGKTQFLNWLTLNNSPEVEDERNYVPVVKTEVPGSPRTAKPLFQRAIWGCGRAYLKNDREEELLERVLLYFQICRVKLWILDEIQNFSSHELRRRIIEITNLLPDIPLICASTHPKVWVEGDPEVAGRFNDYFELKPFKGARLSALLSFIGLLLPFTDESYLDLPESENPEGCADLIEKLTGGTMENIVNLIKGASTLAIDTNKSSLNQDLLRRSWKKLQEEAADKNPISIAD